MKAFLRIMGSLIVGMLVALLITSTCISTDVYKRQGYSCTESLVAFFNDTPNNTLGIFWKNTDKNDALFPRNQEEKPAWMKFREDKKDRMKSNYARKKAECRG